MSKKETKIEKTDNIKSLSVTKMIYFILFLSICGMIILYSSGTFATLPPVNPGAGSAQFNQQHDQADPHGGVDLNALTRIKELEQELENNFSLSTQLQLAHLYNDSGFYQKAIDTYKQYLDKEPNKPDVIVDMGVCYFNLENYDEAKKVMKSALELEPNHQIAKFNLGIVNFSSGDINTAKKWWQETIEINPNTDIAQKAKSLIESH